MLSETRLNIRRQVAPNYDFQPVMKGGVRVGAWVGWGQVRGRGIGWGQVRGRGIGWDQVRE